MQEPQQVWQLHSPPGVRTQLLEYPTRWGIAAFHNSREKVYPRNRHLLLNSGSSSQGIVENISLAVEAVF